MGRALLIAAVLVLAGMLGGCVGNHTVAVAKSSPPVANKMTLVVDSGPAGATGQINHAYVTVTVCAPDSKTQCATIDHVLLDTGSSGLRVVGSVLSAGLTLSPETDAQGQTLEECVTFGGGQTWGPVARADVTLAGEIAAKVPTQILDDAATVWTMTRCWALAEEPGSM